MKFHAFLSSLLFIVMFFLSHSILNAQNAETPATLTDDAFRASNGTYDGTGSFLNVKGVNNERTFLKFTIPNTDDDMNNSNGLNINSVELELRSQSASLSNIKIYKADASLSGANSWTGWNESNLSSSNEPPRDILLADENNGMLSSGNQLATWTLDKCHFAPNETVTLVIVRDNTTALTKFLSKEQGGTGGNKAKLIFNRITDNNTCQGGGGNTLPTVSFSMPMDGATFTEGDNIDVAVNASDSDGSVTGVELYIGTTLIGNDDAAPYQWNAVDHTELQNMAIGTYQLKAIATDDDNATKEEIITIIVEAANGGGGGSSCQQWSGNCNSTDAISRAGKITIGDNNNATGNRFEVVNGSGDINFQIKEDGYTYARDIQVTLSSFPDYIFEDAHDLLSIKDLNNYIKENKHLPNVPSGEEIDKNGIGLGELNIIQMEKIEELTLYIIQLNERLEKLEQENKELRSEERDN